ncbi:MAG: hypothetical protein EPN82_11325 [Bacteroidetes bacterium]|nr:MAG: hypothetical protein EPN82_11325 [Bacteroidota bacterium]
MKYIVIISLFIITVILLNSCKDSLGIEKNVLITTIDTSGNDTTGKDTIQKIEASIDSLHCKEEFLFNNYPYEFPIDEKVILKEAYVDTSTYPVFVWINLDIKNQYGDDIYSALGRHEYTQSIRIKVDSLQGPGGPYKLIYPPNSGYWSELGVRYIDKNDSAFFDGSLSKFDIRFVFDFKHHITALVLGEIPNPSNPDNKTFINLSFVIKYPK